MVSQDRWKQLVEDWKSSGEVAKYWCKKHNIPYVSFINWRRRLDNFSPIKEEGTSSFIEIVEKEKKSNSIEIEFQGFIVRLEKDFDEAVARKCLKLLKEL